MRDLSNELSPKVSLLQAARTDGTTKGTGVNVSEAHGAAIVWRTGTVTDGSHACKVQESDTDVDGNYTDAPASAVTGTQPTLVAADDGVIKISGYIGTKKFIRPVIVTTGSTTGGVIGADVVLGHLRKAPAA